MLGAAADRGRNGDHATGSNEWVISGKHTRDGRPILANDPHLALDQPAELLSTRPPPAPPS
jgi:acyl-homoserine lactone acylase PvdQ